MRRENLILRLEQVALKNPNKTAVQYRDKILTYKEFDDITNNICNNLLQYTKGKNEIIPIRIEDGLNALLAIYGIVKANCAYLPLPSEITRDKCNDILDDIKPQFYVTDFDYELYDEKSIDFNTLLKKTSIPNINIQYKEDNLLYIIHTSGTTGKPKGCMLEDKSVFYRLDTLDNMFLFDENSKFLLSTNYSFDVSVTEIFGWVMGMGSVLIFDKTTSMNLIPEIICNNNITHVAFAPSVFKIIFNKDSFNYFKQLKYIFLAGEKLDLDLAKKIQMLIPDVNTYNMYGPTEATIYCTYFNIRELNSHYTAVPIGKPLQGVNTKIDYISDSNIGELLIGGIGLAKGYYNDDKLTNNKFIVCNNERFYRSGDLVSVKDGQYMFHGRIDNQIKINGVRVEAEEIECKVKEAFKVTNVCIRQEDFSDKKILVAYIETDGKKLDYAYSKAMLDKTLEKYFIPKYFIEVDKFELNKNNKIDTKILYDLFLEQINCNKPKIELQNDIDKKIYEIWKDILKVEFNENDDFFMLGGDSLDVIMLISDLEKEFDVNLPTEVFAKYSKFSEQKELINDITLKNNKDEFTSFWLNELDFAKKVYTSNFENVVEVNNLKDKKLVETIAKKVSNELKPDRIFISDYVVKNKEVRVKLPFKANELDDVDTFPLFSRQEFYIRKNFIQYLTKNVELKANSIYEVLPSINKLIETQLLLKVVIKDNQFTQKDLRNITESDIQFFDLSNCSYEQYVSERNKINNEMITLLKDVPLFNHFMYEVIIIKKNENTFLVMFLIDHNIADASGLNTLERLLINIHFNKPFELNSYNYKDFVLDVLDTNNDEAIQRLIKSDYYKALYNSTKGYNSKFTLENVTSVYEFELENLYRDKTDRANFVFNKIAEIVEQKTGEEVQSYQVLKNLDAFNLKDYKNQVGDFHVSIFVPFNTANEKDLYTKSEDLLEEIYLQKNWHIDYLCSSNAYENNIHTKIFQEVSLSINYLGEFTEKELVDFRIETVKLMEVLKNLHHSKVRITCFNVGDKSYIYILNGMAFDEKFKLKVD